MSSASFVVPSEALGWRFGEQRQYEFFGVVVVAQYRDIEDGWTLIAQHFGATHRQQIWDERYVETESQELAARAVLDAIRDRRAVLVEARRSE